MPQISPFRVVAVVVCTATQVSAQAPPMVVTPELARLTPFIGAWQRDAAGDGQAVTWARLEASWGPGNTWMTWNAHVQFTGGSRIFGRRTMTWDAHRSMYVWVWLDTQSPRINQGTASWTDAVTLVLDGAPFEWRDGHTYRFRTVYAFAGPDEIAETHYRSIDGSPVRQFEKAVLRRQTPSMARGVGTAPAEAVARGPRTGGQDEAILASTVLQDTAWKQRLAFMARGSGVWMTSNGQYRTGENGEPAKYGMRYWMGTGGTTQHGCLWGEDPAREPVVFWSFFTAWDPTRGQLLVQQSSPGGTIGIGYEMPGNGIAEQTFTNPDGTTWEVRHVRTDIGLDTLVTQSFQRSASREWEPRRTYRWIRQPARARTPC